MGYRIRYDRRLYDTWNFFFKKKADNVGVVNKNKYKKRNFIKGKKKKECFKKVTIEGCIFEAQDHA